MFEPFQKLSNGFQKMGNDGLEAAALSYGEVNKGLQDIAAKFTDYSKKSFEDASRAFEQLMGAQSVQQAIEIQFSTLRKRTTPTLRRCRSLARCMSQWRVTRIGRSSK